MYKDTYFSNAIVQSYPSEDENTEDTQHQAPDDDDSATLDGQDPSNSDNSTDDSTWKKRYSDLRSHVDKKTAALTAAQEEKEKAYQQKILDLQTKLKESTSKPADDAVVQRYLEDFPEAMQVIETLTEKKAKEEIELYKAELDYFKEQYMKEQANKTYATILKAHPDAELLAKDQEFKQWFDSQRPKIQDMVRADDPADVIEALDKFKRDTGRTKQAAKQSQLEASKAVVTSPSASVPKGKRVFTEREIHKMTAQEYEKNYEAIMEAAREGRIK